MIDFLGYILISIGIFFDISGCIGLVRFPDVYNRLQASTKCVTLGTIMILVGTALIIGSGAIAAKAGLCAVFILITSPTAAHAIARGAHSAGISLTDKSIVDRYAEEK
ncbi:MAG: monovalent cation/H(+) antiporter subunit G [Planctomycetes bacterium]|nr:monovalent cation/H(+) antiporter subunit G [Planctomycetota bacterium]MBU1518885.1 monovalent cation/H(+) antiporter subunit G [Planctomycetota bacterium]MBU2457075.1 monovalent cation/H(+) antiporter subunit G [Planctomycetota bacterium]MBU2596325.1 monovalent cation/H(+) antiporter subunit G [Planctomycetota bacterium]